MTFRKKGKFSNTLEWGRPVLILCSVLHYDERRFRHSLNVTPTDGSCTRTHHVYRHVYMQF